MNNSATNYDFKLNMIQLDTGEQYVSPEAAIRVARSCGIDVDNDLRYKDKKDGAKHPCRYWQDLFKEATKAKIPICQPLQINQNSQINHKNLFPWLIEKRELKNTPAKNYYLYERQSLINVIYFMKNREIHISIRPLDIYTGRVEILKSETKTGPMLKKRFEQVPGVEKVDIIQHGAVTGRYSHKKPNPPSKPSSIYEPIEEEHKEIVLNAQRTQVIEENKKAAEVKADHMLDALRYATIPQPIPFSKKFKFFPFIWFWKIIARRKMNRMMDIQESYGPTFSTLIRTIGHKEYSTLSDQVDEIVKWCKQKEQRG